MFLKIHKCLMQASRRIDRPIISLRVHLKFYNRREVTRYSTWFGFFHDKEIWRFSVRLSDRSEVTQHKINFVKNCPQWGLNPSPPDHQSNALLTVLMRNLLKISEVSFLLLHAPLHMLGLCLFLESIENNFIRALIIYTDNQIVT